MCIVHLSQFVWWSSHIWSHILVRSVRERCVKQSWFLHRNKLIGFDLLLKYQNAFIFDVYPETISVERKKFRRKNNQRQKRVKYWEKSVSIQKIGKSQSRRELSQMFYLKLVTIIFELIGCFTIFGQFSEFFCDVIWCAGVNFGHWTEKNGHNLCAKRKKISDESATTAKKPNKLFLCCCCALSNFGVIDNRRNRYFKVAKRQRISEFGD